MTDKPAKKGATSSDFTLPDAETVDPATIAVASKTNTAARERMAYFDGIVKTASRDKATVYRVPEEKKQGLTNSLGRALGRCKLRDVLVSGSGQDETGHFVYLKPKPSKKAKA